MKIPFDIKFRPKIESGEYKVENRDGRPVRIICWDKKSEKKYGYHIVALIEFGPQHEESAYFTIDGKTLLKNKEPELFIVTPEEELTDFEKKLWEVLKSEGSPIGPIEKFTNADKEVFHSYTSELLELAKQELCESGEVTDWYAKGKSEALKDLPMWKTIKKDDNANVRIPHVGTNIVGEMMLYVGENAISIRRLTKLPGFKED